MPLLVCASFLLFVLSAVLPAAVTEPAFKCRPGEENDCSKCYSLLVANVTDDDRNQYNLQYAFFPPNNSSPAFVTVIYHYKYDFGNESNDTQIWFWSTSTFNLLYPLHVFQFTSLFFSDLEYESSEVHLTLHQDCWNASEDHMMLLTQRLKIYSTRQSVTSPVDESYNPKVESLTTIRRKHNNDIKYGKLIFSVLFLFPFISWALLLLVVLYINDIGPNPRMKKIERILERGTNRKKTELRYQLQNECVMSIGFVLYTFILSILATDFGRNTEKHLHEEVSQYFLFHEDNLGLRLIYSLSFVPLIQDGVIVAGLAIVLAVVFCYNCKDCCKNKKCREGCFNDCIENIGKRWWKFCAYSNFFPLACALNHLNYIIIAFIHNLYHATSIALIYGVVGIFIYVVLDRLPYLLKSVSKCCDKVSKCCDKVSKRYGEVCKHSKYCDGKVSKCRGKGFKNNLYWIGLFLLKVFAVILLGGYVALDGVVYYFVPIDISFDVFGNNFLSLYNTVVVFFTALVAYRVIKRSYQSPISIFSKARDKIEKDKEIGQDVIEWEDMTKEEKDVDSAMKLWEKVIPETTISIIPVGDSNPVITPVITPATISSENSISATDFEELEADKNIKMEYQVQCRLNSLVTVVVKLE